MTVSDKDWNVVNVVNKDNPEQVLSSQVVEVDIVNEDHGDVDVISDNKNMNVVNMDSSSSITYHTRQSSTITEAVLRYVESPILNQLVQYVTPLSNTGPVKPKCIGWQQVPPIVFKIVIICNSRQLCACAPLQS